jgi:hypothetical protein
MVGAFHCVVVKARTVAARPLLAPVAVAIWVLRSLITFVLEAVRFEMTVLVALTESPAMAAAGSTRTETRKLVKMSWKSASASLELLSFWIFSFSCCGGAMLLPRVGDQRAPGPTRGPSSRCPLDGGVEGFDAVVDVLGPPCLQPGQAGWCRSVLRAVAAAPIQMTCALTVPICGPLVAAAV